jgi:hypothetical protein
MKPRPGHNFLALATGLVIALLKLAGSFLGAIAFFGADVILCVGVGLLSAFFPQASRRWMLLVGGPVYAMVAIFVGIARARGLSVSIGSWWSASILTTAAATIIGAILGRWIARRGEHTTSGGNSSRRFAEEGNHRAH